MKSLLARLRPQGPALSILLSVCLVLALGVTAVVMAWLWPQRTGVLGQEYASGDVFAFDRLSLSMEYLEVEIEAGLIVPVLTRGEVSATVLFGLGRASLDLPPDLAAELSAVIGAPAFREDFSAMYMPATYQSLERLKILCAARQVVDPEHASLAQDILDMQVQDLGLLRLFPRPSPRAAPARPSAARIYTVSFGRADYLEGPRILLDLAKPVPRSLAFRHPGLAAPAFPQLYDEPVLLVTILLYILLGALIWVLSFAITLHLREPEWATRAAGRGGGLPLATTEMPSYGFASLGVPLAAMLGYLVTSLAGAAVFGQAYPAYLVILGLAAVFAALAYRARIPAEHLGLTRRAMTVSIVAGLLVGFYVVVAGSIGYPSGIRPQPVASWVWNVVRSLLIVAPAREFLLRGVAQTTLERYLGRTGAVLLPATVAGLVYLGSGLVGFGPAERTLSPLLMEGLLVVPATNALAGYLYLRTRNLTAPVLVSGLADLLPRVLSF